MAETSPCSLAGVGPIDFEKLLLEQYASVNLGIDFGKLFEDVTLPCERTTLH